MEEAARLCDRVAIMDRGRIIALGAPAELIASLGADQIIEFSASGELDEGALEMLPGVRRVHCRDGRFSLTVSDISVALPALISELARRHAQLGTLATHQATLEDVFVNLTGRMLRDD
jgi:ABC-2 type transport system ATP-binding protein